jgi:hypothetical protein
MNCVASFHAGDVDDVWWHTGRVRRRVVFLCCVESEKQARTYCGDSSDPHDVGSTLAKKLSMYANYSLLLLVHLNSQATIME